MPTSIITRSLELDSPYGFSLYDDLGDEVIRKHGISTTFNEMAVALLESVGPNPAEPEP